MFGRQMMRRCSEVRSGDNRVRRKDLSLEAAILFLRIPSGPGVPENSIDYVFEQIAHE